ncbi:hypothetical protein GDO86_001645 [Hymenochirus boettgeri]|uniref:C2 domain-containing protein n=1 Tax=Hymenochirus boettgeri TaxID=247094 RepID=A0A8T2KFJ4_9PIPI|nr:hypothetical protein GDO86_001645 [Hymenochirus boettgeri]
MKDKDLKGRHRVSLISRQELEDKFIRLSDENLLLKDHARKQEDKIKRMSTKLLRLTSNFTQTGKSPRGRSDGRDLEAEETIEDLQDRLRELERRNEALNYKLITYKQRLQVQSGCRHCPYHTVPARIDSGIRKNIRLPDKIKKGLRVQSSDGKHQTVTAYEETISEEAREEIERMFNLIEIQNNKFDERSAILLRSIESIRSKDAVQDMVLSLHKPQQEENERTIIQENVMLICLQKELREKNTTLCALREQFHQLKEARNEQHYSTVSYERELEEKQNSLTLSHEAVLAQLEDLTSQLKAERAKVVAVEIDQQNVLNLQKSQLEFQERVTDLEKENSLLKENYENLLKSSLESERLNVRQAIEFELKQKIAQLEEQLHYHMSDNTLNKEHLKQEREQNEHLKQEVSKLQIQLVEKNQEVKYYQEKVSAILSSSYSQSIQEQQELTMKVSLSPKLQRNYQVREFSLDVDRWFEDNQRRKEQREEINQNEHQEEQRQREVTEKQVKEEEQRRMEEKEMQRKLCEMDAAHAETILELEKTREMLFLQHKINNDYQDELKTMRLKAESESREKEESGNNYEARILQYKLKIHTLEAQLKDIAYGTFSPRSLAPSHSPNMNMSPVPSLRRGETLFEIHIGGVCFTPQGLKEANDPQPITFCVYYFYDYETHATPVVSGISPRYDFTSQYAVSPDPDFLHYLRVGTLTLELYQAIGGEHRELARGHLKLEAALQSTEKTHGSVALTDSSGVDMGELDYWFRLHGPLSQVQRLHSQRTKARIYDSIGKHGHSEKVWTSPLNNGPQNDLIIRIWGCRSLKVRSLGYQPSPYCVYRFYHYPDHSTAIIPCSNNPQFGDEYVYQLQVTADFERYLQKECMYVYVFDDEDTQPGVYLGRAKVPLGRLAHGENIHGDFALLGPCGKCSGSIHLTMEWKFPYQAPNLNLWKSGSNGNLNPQQIPVSQYETHLKMCDEPTVNLTRFRQSKTRKAVEDQQNMVYSKRGRRETQSASKNQASQKSHAQPPDYTSQDLNMRIKKAVQGEEYHQRRIEEHMEEGDLTSDQTTDISEPRSTDSEDIIIVSKPQKPSSSTIRVEIISLSINPYSEVMADSAVQRLFVEFHFAGVPPEETETPLSLRKPNQGEELYYHFSKVIHLDGLEHAERREFLCMLLEGSDAAEENVRLKFTVVSDPINEDNEECHNVGYAYMDLRPLLRRAEDKVEETIQVFDTTDQEQVIGALRVAVDAKEAAKTVQREKRVKNTW